VVEGPTDAAILRAILPGDLLQDVQFVNGQGRYGAESMARKLLITERIPTVLVIDADVEQESIVQEQRQDLDFLLRQAASGIPYQILLAVPEIEAVFFQDRGVLESLLSRQFTDLEWHLAQQQPRVLLDTLPGGSLAFVTQTLTRLDGSQREVFRQHPLLQSLSQFLVAQLDRFDCFIDQGVPTLLPYREDLVCAQA
jgi:hypothetical protein